MELILDDSKLLKDKLERERYIDKVHVLDKVKSLKMLPDDTFITANMVADYYEVDYDVINKVWQRYRDELTEDGCRVLTGNDLKAYKDFLKGQGVLLKSRKAVMLANRRGILRIGMVLKDSVVAAKVRTYLLNMENMALAVKHQSLGNQPLDGSVRMEVTTLEENAKLLQIMYSMNQHLIQQRRELNALRDAIQKQSEEIEQLKNEQAALDINLSGTVTAETIATKLELFSVNDKPHKMFINHVANHLKFGVDPLKVGEGYKDDYVHVVLSKSYDDKIVPTVRYTEKAFQKIANYIDQFFVPVAKFIISGRRKGEFDRCEFRLTQNGITFKFNERTYLKYSQPRGRQS